MVVSSSLIVLVFIAVAIVTAVFLAFALCVSTALARFFFSHHYKISTYALRVFFFIVFLAIIFCFAFFAAAFPAGVYAYFRPPTVGIIWFLSVCSKGWEGRSPPKEKKIKQSLPIL